MLDPAHPGKICRMTKACFVGFGLLSSGAQSLHLVRLAKEMPCRNARSMGCKRMV